jgi:hypothetical protein
MDMVASMGARSSLLPAQLLCMITPHAIFLLTLGKILDYKATSTSF